MLSTAHSSVPVENISAARAAWNSLCQGNDTLAVYYEKAKRIFEHGGQIEALLGNESVYAWEFITKANGS